MITSHSTTMIAKLTQFEMGQDERGAGDAALAAGGVGHR
jgi:hypothetical protein